MKWMSELLRQPKRTPSAAATLHRGPDGVYVLRIVGALSRATVDRLEAVGSEDFKLGTKDLKVLIILTDFQGWARCDDWRSIEFFAEQEQNIWKIAVVGAPQWESETRAFLADSHRGGEVRYFVEGLEPVARSWLTE